MSPAPLPLDEARRLITLRACEVLDTPAEQVFDDLVLLAAQAADVPIALVSLVDETRQWFKARVGIAVAATPRDHAFCAYGILSPEALTVEDAELDVRFSDNPLVREDPRIRFYHGIPLTMSDGSRVGTLCVLDRRPRKISGEQQHTLSLLARQVVTHLELRRTVGELAQLRARERNRDDVLLLERIALDNHLGSWLHEGLLQDLAGITYQLSAIIAQMQQPTPDVGHPMDRLIEQLRETVRGCCRIVDERLGYLLARDGLGGALHTRLERMAAAMGKTCAVSVKVGKDVQLGPLLSFRITEFVECAARRAMAIGARRLHVHLLEVFEAVELVVDSDEWVSDGDGDGGRAALHERAAGLNAAISWDIHSAGLPRMRCWIPLEPEMLGNVCSTDPGAGARQSAARS